MKRRKVIAGVLVAAILGVAVWGMIRLRAPVYDGRTLDEWGAYLDGSRATTFGNQIGSFEQEECVAALSRKKRTAIHELVERMRREANQTTRFDYRIRNWLADRFPRALNRVRPQLVEVNIPVEALLEGLDLSYLELRDEMEKELGSTKGKTRWFGLKILTYADHGREQVVAELAEVFKQPPLDPQFYRALILTAGLLGEDAEPLVPTIISRLDSPDPFVVPTLQSLAKIGPGAKEALPRLMELHSRASPLNKMWLYECFARMGEPDPNLVKLLGNVLASERNDRLKLEAAIALLQIQPEHSEAQAFVLKFLEDDEFRQKSGFEEADKVLNRLEVLGADADFTTNALHGLIFDRHIPTMDAALWLGSKTPTSEVMLTLGGQRLEKRESLEVERALVWRLLSIDPSHEVALEYLIEWLEMKGDKRGALDLTARIGTNALPAKSVLLELSRRQYTAILASRARRILERLEMNGL